MGDRFGPYELLEPLASGGMARVVRARMTGALGFEKIVAIKFMLPGFAADPMAVKMFVDEARLAATLTHASIVGILDFGERDGEYYIAMEYVSGANVRVLVKRAVETSRLPPPALAAYIIAEAARGLEYAHAKLDTEGRLLNIVHRDVSPQNIVVSWEGEVKILDFGIARSRQRSFETAVGTIKGKYAYMSPEQASGQGIDHRSDLFSLGAVLYELLTGAKAFPQPGVSALEKVRRAEFVPPENLRPELPPALLSIVHRALARDPDQRYRSASALLDDLRLYMAEERSRGAHGMDAGALASWAEGLFEVSDGDIDIGEAVPDLPPPLVPETRLLPGWESEAASSEPEQPLAPRRPTPTARESLTFTGSDELELGDSLADVTRVTMLEPSGWALPSSPAPSAVPAPPPPGFAPLPAGLPPPELPVIAAALPQAPPVASPSIRPPAPTAPRERVSRVSSGPAVPPRNSPHTTPPAADPAPRRLDVRSTAVLFVGGVVGMALVTTIFHFAIGSGRVADPTPTPIPLASPSPTPTEALPVESPIAIITTASAIDYSDPLRVRPGEKRDGLLSISSEPPRGQVFLDGRPIAETPALIPNVPYPRRYVVEVRLDGYSPWSREIDAIDDQALQVLAQLVAIDVPGKLKISVPRGGTAFVDGRVVGKGPVVVTVDVSPGRHQLRLKDANGFILREYEVLVAKGRTTEIDLPPL